MSSFQIFNTYEFQVDSGANIWAITDKLLLLYFLPSENNNLCNVNGETFCSSGWGAMLIGFTTKVFLCYPVYVCPSNPKNTMSLGALKVYLNFRKAKLDTLAKVKLVNYDNNKYVLPTIVRNNLDFVRLSIYSLTPNSFTQSF